MKFNIKRYLALVGVFVLVVALAIPAFAEGSTVSSAVSTALASTASEAMSLIASVIPAALGIMGAIVVVSVGVRAFKRAAK